MDDLNTLFTSMERPEDLGRALTPTAALPPEGIAGAQITTAEDAMRFLTAGKATVTLRSLKTGTRFTYKIGTSEDGQVHFVSLLNGPDNYANYQYFGYIRRGVFLPGGRKAKVHPGAPSVVAFKWVWEQLAQRNLPSTVEIWHEGKCGRCGRRLTVPESIASGLGPECAGKMSGE